MIESIVRPPDSSTKRYVVYIVRYVGHDGDVYTREYCTPDKEDAIRVAEGYRKSGRRVAVTATLRDIITMIADTIHTAALAVVRETKNNPKNRSKNHQKNSPKNKEQERK